MTRVLGLLMAIAAAVDINASPARATASKRLKGEILGTFSFHACPADAPAGAQCLHDDVTGHLPHLGQSIGSFEVVFDIAQFGNDTCGPISKTGSFIAANGDWLHVDANGTFCFNTIVAVYKYRVIGGTGRFAGANGAGHWIVPPPSTFDGVAGTGDEVLTGSLVTMTSHGMAVLP